MSVEKAVLASLNAPTAAARLEAFTNLCNQHKPTQTNVSGSIENINNHIHTIYSFSPYSPSAAVWCAMEAGLSTAGIMDHDSVSGCREFIEAGRIANFPVTVGVELRASMAGSPLANRRFNNPDQEGIIYMALHAIPHDQLDRVDAFLRPLREARGLRNRAMTKNLSEIFAPYGVELDYDRDVLPCTQAHEGGSVTERHLLYALSLKLIERFGKGASLISFLKDTVGLKLSAKIEGYLGDVDSEHYVYDLLGLLKAEFVSRFYIPATDECPPVADVLALAREVGAFSAYAYLGDVGDSVTGDKRAQAFEDSYLDELFCELDSLGFRSVTYMPSRNTMAQLERVQALCDQHGFFQISGEDINSSRQQFICAALQNPAFAHLISAAWALIGHENTRPDFFSKEAKVANPTLSGRIAAFAAAGRALYN